MTDMLNLIGAPSSAGAYAPGQEKAPAAFRRHGLPAALERAGWVVQDRGDIAGFRWRPDLRRPEAMNLPAVEAAAKAVAGHVADAMADGGSALVLGGDCTIELGVVAGALADSASVGLIYIDGDADLNVPETADGALDWMGVGHLLDLPGALSELSGLGARRPMLAPSDVMLFGAYVVTDPEAKVIATRNVQHVALKEIKQDPEGAARQALAWSEKFDRLLVHLDIDVMAFTRFPLAENIRYEGRHAGLDLSELAAVLDVVLAAPNWRALTITEVNPDHAPDEAAVFAELIGVLSHALGARFEQAARTE